MGKPGIEPRSVWFCAPKPVCNGPVSIRRLPAWGELRAGTYRGNAVHAEEGGMALTLRPPQISDWCHSQGPRTDYIGEVACGGHLKPSLMCYSEKSCQRTPTCPSLHGSPCFSGEHGAGGFDPGCLPMWRNGRGVEGEQTLTGPYHFLLDDCG